MLRFASTLADTTDEYLAEVGTTRQRMLDDTARLAARIRAAIAGEVLFDGQRTTALAGANLRGLEGCNQSTAGIVEIGAVGEISGHQDSSRDGRRFRIENTKRRPEFKNAGRSSRLAMCTNESQADSIPYLQNANSSPEPHPPW